MASPEGSSITTGGFNEQEPRNPQQPALAVTPINSMPYIGSSVEDTASSSTIGDTATKPVEKSGPSMVFFPSQTSQRQLGDILGSAKNGVGLTGSAAMGKLGPVVGLVDIGECDDAYLFRVSLPGVARDERDFSCEINPEGKILIKGVTTTGERTVCKYSQIFRMQTQNLCPPGHFSIEFDLPGPVDHQQFSGCYGTDGILEGIVKKRR